jgi:hypothetical protein
VRAISLARPSVFRFMADVQRYRDGAAAVLARLAAGMAIDIGLRLPLEQAAQMPQRLEAGETSGSLLLIP